MTGRMSLEPFNVGLMFELIVLALTSPEYVVSPADFVSIIREDLKPEAAAPLLCGMSLYVESLIGID